MTLLRMCFLGLAVFTSGLLCADDTVQEESKPKGEDFTGKRDHSGRNFKDKVLRDAIFEGCVLDRADFENAKLTGANFRRAHCYATKFKDATLTDADFRDATLDQPYFYPGADLTGANFQYVDLSKTSWNNVKSLRKANFRDSKGLGSVRDLDLSECDFRGADLSKMLGQPNSLLEAKYNKKTRWPTSFPEDDAVAAGAVLVEKYSKEELEADFAYLDRNADKRLSGAEMRRVVDYDTDKDGGVTYQEFVAGRQK